MSSPDYDMMFERDGVHYLVDFKTAENRRPPLKVADWKRWATKPYDEIHPTLLRPEPINARGETRLARKIRCCWDQEHVSASRWVNEFRGDTIYLFHSARPVPIMKGLAPYPIMDSGPLPTRWVPAIYYRGGQYVRGWYGAL